MVISGRSPCGERGLKSASPAKSTRWNRSLPVRGAWIEIVEAHEERLGFQSSLPVRGAWIEISGQAAQGSANERSLPVRGAWIEIASPVAPSAYPKGRSPCGERGLKFQTHGQNHCVAGRSPCGERGLKFFQLFLQPKGVPSLPVRGAWIEINAAVSSLIETLVAPRAGSVD